MKNIGKKVIVGLIGLSSLVLGGNESYGQDVLDGIWIPEKKVSSGQDNKTETSKTKVMTYFTMRDNNQDGVFDEYIFEQILSSDNQQSVEFKDSNFNGGIDSYTTRKDLNGEFFEYKIRSAQGKTCEIEYAKLIENKKGYPMIQFQDLFDYKLSTCFDNKDKKRVIKKLLLDLEKAYSTYESRNKN